MSSGFEVTQPLAVLPLTSHQPPPAEVSETMGNVTPWAITWMTGAVVLGAVRKFTPSGAITVNEVGWGDVVGVGDGLGVAAGRGALLPHPASTPATTNPAKVRVARMCITYSAGCAVAAIRWRSATAALAAASAKSGPLDAPATARDTEMR